MKSFWKNLADKAIEIMIVCDNEGKVCDANQQALSALDYTLDEFVGESADILFLDKTFNILKAIQNYKAEMKQLQTNLYRKNKTCFPVIMNFIRDEETDFFLILAVDNSDTLKAQKEIEFVNETARNAGKARDEFVANVTHELRTPVNGIKGHTQYLLTTQLDKEQVKELRIISECCQNMEKLINNILDFSKLESGKFTINNNEFVFADFIRYISETNGKLIEEKGLRFIINVDKDVPEKLIGDDFRLTQVLANLLSNAMKFTSRGYIAVDVNKTMQHGREIELFFIVMDTGIGIQPEKKDMLFESFTQADASISRAYGGTGLGLAITKQLVELMGGTISLESEYGKGSSFSFTVRMQIPDGVEITESQEIKIPVRIDNKARTQLLMEDVDRINSFGSEENLEEIERILEKLGLCLELDNFEKAEGFADSIKALVAEGPKELKAAAFRMQLMIRKEDEEGSKKQYDLFCELLKQSVGN